MHAVLVTSIALADRHAAQPFNGLFYSTIATVIPVLFLAIAVQGGTYSDLLRYYVANARLYRRTARLKGVRWRRPLMVNEWVFTRIFVGIAWFIVIAGTSSEIAVILALYTQRASSWGAYIAVGSVILLVLVAGAGPAAMIFRASTRAQEDSDPATGDSPGQAAATPEGQKAEPA